jgi:hypothetical protein
VYGTPRSHVALVLAYSLRVLGSSPRVRIVSVSPTFFVFASRLASVFSAADGSRPQYSAARLALPQMLWSRVVRDVSR